MSAAGSERPSAAGIGRSGNWRMVRRTRAHRLTDNDITAEKKEWTGHFFMRRAGAVKLVSAPLALTVLDHC